MKAIRIDTNNGTIYEVKLEGGLEEKQDHVGGYIGVYYDPLFKADVFYCDDFLQGRGNWTREGYMQKIQGCCLLLGKADQNGDSTGYDGIDLIELRKLINFEVRDARH